MPVKLRGKHFHYRFSFQKKIFSGRCDGCYSERQALAFERRIREEVEAVRSQKTVKALVENYRYELTGGEPILIFDAFEKSMEKPLRRMPSREHIRQKRNYWLDFASFLASEFPEAAHLADIRKSHCEAYTRYLQDHGRFVKEVATTVHTGRRGRNAVERKYTREWLISAKTIVTIAGVCSETIRKLAEDAGIVVNPWVGVPGNLNDSKAMVEALSELHTPCSEGVRPIVVLDGGIATEENLTWLREHGYDYAVNGKRITRNLKNIIECGSWVRYFQFQLLTFRRSDCHSMSILQFDVCDILKIADVFDVRRGCRRPG